MSRDKLQLLSPLFLKYQSEYEKNPRSRVFAPLAETYRKLGMTDKAMEILAQGIRFHPTYVMGYLGLAFCYFDIKQYNLSYSTLRPLVESNRDNIRLQKLFADICLQLNHKEEALETYKYLLFINPRDKEIAAQVTMLENLLESQYRPTHKPIYIPEEELKSDYKSSPTFDVEKLQEKPKSDALDFDDWLALDLSKETKTPEKTEDQYDFWNLNKGTTQLQTSPKEVIPQKQEERVFEVKLDFDQEELNEKPIEKVATDAPLVTHTLVDLYCGQGHIEKALEVLEKILALNPNDKKTIDKIAEIKSLMGNDQVFEEIKQPEPIAVEAEKSETILPLHKTLIPLEENTVSEEEGRDHLMSLIDETFGHEEPVEIIAQGSEVDDRRKAMEDKLQRFLRRIQQRALDYQSRV
jgi:tetratricopeptide (TPR) repeat protein